MAITVDITFVKMAQGYEVITRNKSYQLEKLIYPPRVGERFELIEDRSRWGTVIRIKHTVRRTRHTVLVVVQEDESYPPSLPGRDVVQFKGRKHYLNQPPKWKFWKKRKKSEPLTDYERQTLPQMFPAPKLDWA